jgi:hemoglobin-like flavoprotein
VSLAKSIRRIVFGPTTEEIDADVAALGGPPYPIPPMSTAPPAPLVPADPDTWRNVNSDTPPTDQERAARVIDAARARRDDPLGGNGTPIPLRPPTPGRTYRIPDLDRERDTLINLRPAVDRLRAATGAFAISSADLIPGDPVTQPTPDMNTPETEVPGDGHSGGGQRDPFTDTGSHHLNDTNTPGVMTHTATCPTCAGTGTVTRTVSDLLRDVVDLIGDRGDDVIREFYRRLLSAAPTLTPLFPEDLITAVTGDKDSPGALQRDRLLQALLAVADLYGAGDDAMTRLDAAITSMGNRHAAFARPDGTVQGATEEEYDAVIAVFLGLCRDAFTDAFTDDHHAVWKDALRYVKTGMLWAQWHSEMTFPRMPRTVHDR